MKDDPNYLKLVQKSFILKQHHRKHSHERPPQVQLEPNIIHKLVNTGFLSTVIHLIAYPLDTIKIRKIANCKTQDIAYFQRNKVITLTPYLGFLKGYLSLMIGNMCYLTLGQQNFYLGVLGEGVLKTFIDISKISTQMGNKQMNMDVTKRVFVLATTYAVLRDLIARGSYLLIVRESMQRMNLQLKKSNSLQNNIYFISAIVSTIISHPFDVLFTKTASQQSLKYTNLWKTPLTILKEENIGKFLSGIEFRLFYNLVSVFVIGYSYAPLMSMVIIYLLPFMLMREDNFFLYSINLYCFQLVPFCPTGYFIIKYIVQHFMGYSLVSRQDIDLSDNIKYFIIQLFIFCPIKFRHQIYLQIYSQNSLIHLVIVLQLRSSSVDAF